MSVYGLRVSDVLGNSTTLTANNAILLSCGNLTMPTTGTSGQVYGTDIALGATYPVESIGVMVYPTKFTFQAKAVRWPWNVTTSCPFTWYALPTGTYYTKALDTGIMTTWTPGTMAMSVTNANNWDGVRGIMPLASWDVADGITSISNAHIWAATAYTVYDYSAATFLEVYSVGTLGVSEVNYSIYLRAT
jgi:hypothetical protein